MSSLFARRSLRFVSSFAALILLAALYSCGSKKQVAASSSASASSYTSSSSFSASSSSDAAIVANYSPSWDRLQLPITLRLRQPKSISLSGTAIFDRGRSLTISLRFPIIGEVAAVQLTADSVIAIDKVSKNFVAEPLSGVLAGYPVTVADIQDLLLGRPFLIGSSDPISKTISKFDLEPSSTGRSAWLMIPKSHPDAIEYGFSLDDMFRLVAMVVKAGSREPVAVTYSSPVSTSSGIFASTLSFSAVLGKTSIDFSVESSFGKAKWNSDVQLRELSVPKNYSRLSSASLMKVLTSF